MIGDTTTHVKGRRTRNAARKVTGSEADAGIPPIFRPANTLVLKGTVATECATRGQTPRNRPANPLTCRASDLLCLDANALKCPLFRRISSSMRKRTKTRISDQVGSEFHHPMRAPERWGDRWGDPWTSHRRRRPPKSLLFPVLFPVWALLPRFLPGGVRLIEIAPFQVDDAASAAQFINDSRNCGFGSASWLGYS